MAITHDKGAQSRRRQRRKLADLLRLTKAEASELDQWQSAGAHDALRLLLRQLFLPAAIPRIVRNPLPDRRGKTLVEVLLTEGPGAAIAIIDESQRAIERSLRSGRPD